MLRKSTKNYFEDSLSELVDLKPFEKITVKDITENCDMTTRTFYNHFKDKYDLVLWTYSSKVDKYLEESGNSLDFKDLCNYLIEIFLKNRKLYISAFENIVGRESFIRTACQYSTDITIMHIKRKFGLKEVPEELKFSIRFFYNGGFYIGYEWLNGEIMLSKEEYLDNLLNFMPDILKQYLL